MKIKDIIAIIFMFAIIEKIFMDMSEFNEFSFWIGFLFCISLWLVVDNKKGE